MICRSSSRALGEIPLVESESRSPPCLRQVRPAAIKYNVSSELNAASTTERPRNRYLLRFRRRGPMCVCGGVAVELLPLLATLAMAAGGAPAVGADGEHGAKALTED